MLTLYLQGIERGVAITHSQPYFKRGRGKARSGFSNNFNVHHFTWMKLLMKSQQWMKLTKFGMDIFVVGWNLSI